VVQLFSFFNLGVGCDGCWIPRPDRFAPGKHPIPIVDEAGWIPAPIWPGVENSALKWVWTSSPSARSALLFRLSYPGSTCCIFPFFFVACVTNFFLKMAFYLFGISPPTYFFAVLLGLLDL
jgi:hypothetical protein